jgi:hypothetical protein
MAHPVRTVEQTLARLAHVFERGSQTIAELRRLLAAPP